MHCWRSGRFLKKVTYGTRSKKMEWLLRDVIYFAPPEIELFVKIKIWEGEALRSSTESPRPAEPIWLGRSLALPSNPMQLWDSRAADPFYFK